MIVRPFVRVCCNCMQQCAPNLLPNEDCSKRTVGRMLAVRNRCVFLLQTISDRVDIWPVRLPLASGAIDLAGSGLGE